MSNLRFAVDVDGVLRNITTTMVDIYNNEFNCHLSEGDLKDYDVSISFPGIKEKTGYDADDWFFNIHGKDIFLGSPMIKNAAESVRILRRYGHVTIVTYQKTNDNKIDTLTWLHQNGIVYDSICFTKDKSIFNFDYIIDDNVDHIIGTNCNCGILISAPYNMEFDAFKYKHIERFATIYNFAKYIEKVNNP